MDKGKYFIAIVLRGAAFEHSEGLKQQLFEKFNLKGALRSPSHITLHRPFEWKTAREQELITTLSSFKQPEPFELQLNGFDRFGERVIYLAVEENPTLQQLHHDLTRFAVTNLQLFNERDDKRGFHPHVTIAFRDLRKKNFQPAWDFIKTGELRHQVTVSGFSLLRLEDIWRELHRFGP